MNSLRISQKPLQNITSFQKQSIESFQSALASKNLTRFNSLCICGSSNCLQILDYDRYGLDSPTVVCKDCGLTRAKYFFSNESMLKFYSDFYRQIYVGSKTPPESFFNDQKIRGKYLVDVLKSYVQVDPKAENVLEIGCGAGGILKSFQDEGFLVTGWDFDENYLKFGREKGLRLFHFNEFEKMELSNKFDYVVLSHVLEHFNSPIEEIQKIRNFLKPNGKIICEVPGFYNIHRAYYRTINYFQNAHTYNFTSRHLDYCFEKAGFLKIISDNRVFGIYQVGDKNETFNTKNYFLPYVVPLAYLYLVELLWKFKLNPFYLRSTFKKWLKNG